MMKLLIIVFFTVFIIPGVTAAEKSKLFISAAIGEDTKFCGNGSVPCRTLNHAYELLSPSGLNSTILVLEKGTYSLHKSLVFVKVKDLSLIGGHGDSTESNTRAKIICEPNVSVAFFLSDNITLQDLKIVSCGGWQESAISKQNAEVIKFKTAIHFDYCRNIWMRNVDIIGSIGHGANFFEIGGVLNVTNCVFENNTVSADALRNKSTSNKKTLEQVGYIISVGGVFVTLNNYIRNRPYFKNVTQARHESYIQGNSYIFTKCSFIGNGISGEVAPTDSFQGHALDQLSVVKGGGLGIFFVGKAENNMVLIQNCRFLANQAYWGGGLQVEFSENTSRNNFTVRSSVFQRNIGHSAGGGARVGHWRKKGVFNPNNEIRFVDSVFRDNRGNWGGGISVYGTSIFCNCKQNFKSKKTFSFHSCRWFANKANVGSAIGTFLFNQNRENIGPEVPFHVEFIDSQVEDNAIEILEENVQIGEGAIYNVGVSIVFRGKTIIKNNTYTALALDGGTLELYDDVEFVGNKGVQGGAIAMYGYSQLILMKKSRLLFKENSCLKKGGAMFIQTPGSPRINYGLSKKNPNICFFAYEDDSRSFNQWDTEVIFQENKAPDDSLGHSVFATTLKKCRMQGETRLNNSVLDWKFIRFNRTTTDNVSNDFRRNTKEIATSPVDIIYNVQDWHVSPGEVFSPTVHLRDEKNNSVKGIVEILISNSSSYQEDDPSSVFLQTDSSLFLTHGKISFLKIGGHIRRKFIVILQHIGRQILRKVIRVASLKPCNPGFYLKDGNCVCQDKLDGISRCDKNGKTIYLKAGYWGGMVDETFYIHRCPRGFCACPRNNMTLIAQDECVFNVEQMCNGNREPGSTLCGKCKEGFSVVFGHSDCHKCGKYGFLVVIPVYLVQILVFVKVAMLLDVDWFSGFLNGFFYSYQVMLQVVGERFFFDPFMLFVINFFNFRPRIGSHLCFSSDMDYADKLFFNLAISVITLLVVVFLAKLVGKYPNWCFSRRVKGPFRAICTILVLCYTGITSSCLGLLDPVVFGNTTVLFISGSTEFFKGKHAFYGSIAIFFMFFFVILFPLVLMYRPFCTRLLRPVFNLNRFKPFFDVLQSCYKDQHRSFAAFYLVCRLVVLVIAIYIPIGPVRRFLIEVTCITVLSIFTYVRPYKRSRQEGEADPKYAWENKSDTILLFNLSLMAVIATATENSDISKRHKAQLTTVIKVLAYVPMVALACYIYKKTKSRCASGCCSDNRDLEGLQVTDLGIE
ncbi:uncharacterized protein LOC111339659 [Stylophora pistillata]|nr:uncharacterized protein LOC111339659 [Stylophora pistillata]